MTESGGVEVGGSDSCSSRGDGTQPLPHMPVSTAGVGDAGSGDGHSSVRLVDRAVHLLLVCIPALTTPLPHSLRPLPRCELTYVLPASSRLYVCLASRPSRRVVCRWVTYQTRPPSHPTIPLTPSCHSPASPQGLPAERGGWGFVGAYALIGVPVYAYACAMIAGKFLQHQVNQREASCSMYTARGRGGEVQG